jgi:hypothetical protein
LIEAFLKSDIPKRRVYLNDDDYNLLFKDSPVQDLLIVAMKMISYSESRPIKARRRIMKDFEKDMINHQILPTLRDVIEVEEELRVIFETNMGENWRKDLNDANLKQKIKPGYKLNKLDYEKIAIKDVSLFLIKLYSLKLDLMISEDEAKASLGSGDAKRKVTELKKWLEKINPNELELVKLTLLLEADYWKAEYYMQGGIVKKSDVGAFKDAILINSEKETQENARDLRTQFLSFVKADGGYQDRTIKNKTMKDLKDYVGMLDLYAKEQLTEHQ